VVNRPGVEAFKPNVYEAVKQNLKPNVYKLAIALI